MDLFKKSNNLAWEEKLSCPFETSFEVTSSSPSEYLKIRCSSELFWVINAVVNTDLFTA